MNSKVRRNAPRDNRRGGGAPASEGSPLEEKVVHVGRCAKVVKGGRRFSFSALVVVGDKNGRVGMGYGRAHEVPEAVKKANEHARNSMSTFDLTAISIPHHVLGRADGGEVMLRPACDGTGLIAGGGVRAVLELAGVKNVLSKSMRSSTPLATVRATFDALKRLRSREKIMRMRGKNVQKEVAS